MRRKDPLTLKRARLRARFTQRELAYLCRVSQTTIYLLERPGPAGMNTCTDDLAERIAERLGVDVEDLFEAQSIIAAPIPATGNVVKSRKPANRVAVA